MLSCWTMATIDFVEWVEEQMREQAMNQAYLSKRSGLSTSAISRIMSRSSKPTAETIKAIARALHVSTEDALQAAGILPDYNDQRTFEEINSMLAQLPPGEVDEITEIVRIKLARLEKEKSGKSNKPI